MADLTQIELPDGNTYDIKDANADEIIEITATDYDALSYAEKHNGKYYHITDRDSSNVSISTKVKQNATSTDANYEVLFSNSANNTTEVEETRKDNGFIYNPSKKALTLGDRYGSTGYYSVALGTENTACGVSSSSSTDMCSVAIGRYNTSSDYCAIAMGYGNTASDDSAVALGHSNTASGDSSFAAGYYNTASGDNAIALGYHNTASNWGCFATGRECTASESYDFAEGEYTEASGGCSHAAGWGTKATGQCQFVIGKYNDNTFIASNLFCIGNGTSDNNRSNALTVNDSGDIEIQGGYYLKNKDINIWSSTPPSTTINCKGLLCYDAFNSPVYSLKATYDTNGAVTTTLSSHNYNHGSGITFTPNEISIIKNKDNTNAYSVTDPAAFRSAIDTDYKYWNEFTQTALSLPSSWREILIQVMYNGSFMTATYTNAMIDTERSVSFGNYGTSYAVGNLSKTQIRLTIVNWAGSDVTSSAKGYVYYK